MEHKQGFIDEELAAAPVAELSRPTSTRSALAADVRAILQRHDDHMKTQEGRVEELIRHHRQRDTWRFYRMICQFRMGYFAFLVLMVIVMTSFTCLMEVFFAIFLPSARFDQHYWLRAILLLLFLPFILFFLSYFFEETLRFFFDAINKIEGALPNFRLALVVVIHYLRHRHEMQKLRLMNADAVLLSDSEANSSSGDPSPERQPSQRKSLLRSSSQDPFDEEEDDDWHDTHQTLVTPAEVNSVRELMPAIIEDEELNHVSPPSVARARWNRAIRAVTAAVKFRKVKFGGPEIDHSTFILVDFICPVLFEVITATYCIVVLVTLWSPYDAFLAYIRTGVTVVAMYLGVWMVVHFWSSRNQKMRTLVSNYRRERRKLMRATNALDRSQKASSLWLMDVGCRFYRYAGDNWNPIPSCLATCGCNRSKSDKHEPEPTTSPPQPVPETGDDLEEARPSPTSKLRKAAHVAAAFAHVERVRQARAELKSRNPYRRLSLNAKIGVMAVATFLSAMLALASFFLGWPFVGFCLVKLSALVQQRFPQIFGRAFKNFITSFVLFSLVFFSSTYIIGTFVTGGEFVLGPYSTESHDARLLAATNTSNGLGNSSSMPTLSSGVTEYPICTVNYRGLSVLDLALIADAAYGKDRQIQETALINRFAGTDLSSVRFVDGNNNRSHQHWMEIFFPSINMTVVAVRGTASATDALEDLHFWFGISIMQAVNIFVPFLRQLPQAFVVNMLSMKLLTGVMPPPVFASLLEHVEKRSKELDGNLVLTGHSLGGAIAGMLGARTQTRAVSFSGPGLVYSRGRFNITSQAIRDNVLTLKPETDIVPKVDKLGGVVVQLRCKEKSPVRCHSTYTHMCELYSVCGDPRGRNWATNKQCNDYEKLPNPVKDEM